MMYPVRLRTERGERKKRKLKSEWRRRKEGQKRGREREPQREGDSEGLPQGCPGLLWTLSTLAVSSLDASPSGVGQGLESLSRALLVYLPVAAAGTRLGYRLPDRASGL